MEKNIKKEQLIPSFKEIREKYETSKEALAAYFTMGKEALKKLKAKDVLEEEIKVKRKTKKNGN